MDDTEAYLRFVNRLGIQAVTPFTESDLFPCMCEFFVRWLDLASKRRTEA